MKIVDNVLLRVYDDDIIEGELRIPDGVTAIAKNACAQNFELERVVIPNSVKRIETCAFSECDELSEIEFLTDSLDYLGASAFSECSNLAQLTLPDIKEMGTHCFEKCTDLQMVTLKGAVVGANCFSECTNLVQVDLLHSNIEIKENAFEKCRGLMYISAPSGINFIDNFAFNECKSLIAIEINSNTIASENAFAGCTIQEISIVDKSKKIQLENQILSFSNQQNSIVLTLGENKKDIKQVIFVDSNCDKIFNFDFDDLNTKIKDFSVAYEKVGAKTLVEWVNLIAKVQKVDTKSVRLPQAEALLTLETEDERREFIENLGKYNKISGKFRNLNIYDRIQILKLCKLMGVFENDDKQFIISANTLSKDLPNFIMKMSGQNVVTHKNTDFLITDWFKKIEYPQDFSAKRAKFFADYYKALLINNKTDLLAISINNFADFSKSINVVTPEKIEQMLVDEMSNDVPENRKELAHLMALQGVVGNDKFAKLSAILSQAERVRPNIFDNFKSETTNNFDRRNATKLFDSANFNFQYEWLDKDSPYNLLIGNICGCCAKLGGAGEDIMIKSATHPDVQTMAIKRKDGEYIGKATVYLNREKGYAVFNNIELNRNFSSRANVTQLNEVLDAFLRGVNAFATTYNKSAKLPLQIVTVGADRNKVIEQMRARLPQSAKIYESIDFENYKKGGDSAEQQFIAYDINKVVAKNINNEINKMLYIF